jgi:hypothetical protein
MRKPLTFLLIALLLAACAPTMTPAPTLRYVPPKPTYTLTPPTPTPTLEFTPIPPTPLPIEPTLAVMTPDSVQVEKWKEYESALAKSTLSFLTPEMVFCEWEILGRSEQEEYVWAVCESGGSGMSVPVVINLKADGSIQNVETPGTNWSSSILKMFPADVREKFDHYNFGGAEKMSNHIDWRRKHPKEPPLIVLSATPAP